MVLVFSAIFFPAGPDFRLSARNASISCKAVDFIDSLTEYDMALDMMKKCEKLECDLLHQLEIEKLSVGDRNKLATKLRICLQDRRYYKNIVEEYMPLVNILADVDIKKSIHKFEQVLGQIRKAESYHENRKYYPRIMKYEECEPPTT